MLWKLYLLRIFRIAFREPTTRGISFLNLSGFLVGAFAVMVVISTMNGFYDSVHRAISVFAGDISVLFYESLSPTRRQRAVELLQRRYGDQALVFDAAPVLLQAHGRSFDGLLEAYEDAQAPWQTLGISDAAQTCGKGPVVFLGQPLQERLGVKPGELMRVSLLLATGVKSLTVRLCQGVSVGFYDYDQKLVWMSRSFLGTRAHGLPFGAKIFRSRDHLAALTHEAEDLKSNLGRGFYTFTWYERHQNLFEAIRTERKMVLWVIAFIVLVASFNLISHLYVHYRTKVRAFQLLYVLGERRWRMMLLAILQGGGIGVLGSSLGVGLAAGAVWVSQSLLPIPIPMEIYNLKTLPLSFNVTAGLGLILGSGVLAMMVSVIPALQTKVLFQAAALQE